MSTYYFPEGAFGPICDLPQTDEDLSYFSRAAIAVEDDDTEIVYGESYGLVSIPRRFLWREG